MTDDEGVTTQPLGEPVKFKFLNKLDSSQLKAFQNNQISKTINLINSKQKHSEFLQEEIKVKRIEDQLSQPILQQRIKLFEERIRNEVCSDLPNAFWHRKHIQSVFLTSKILMKKDSYKSPAYPNEFRNLGILPI
jgi:predicted transglutaminase-like protease